VPARCSARTASRKNPTVSYAVYAERDVRQAAVEAEGYCHENYRRSARIVGDLVTGGERVLTFECVVV